MDKELMDLLVDLKINSRAFVLLANTILDNSRLGYDNESLVITGDTEIFAIIKGFYNDEYNYRLNSLKETFEAEKRAKAENKTPGEA